MSMGVKRIETVYLPTTDPEKGAVWYVDNLGLNLYRPASEDQAQLTLESGQSLFLIRTAVPTSLSYQEVSGTEQCVLTLEVKDIHAVYEQLRKRGAQVSELEDSGECGLNFFVLDPAGNKLDIWSGWPRRD